MSIRKYKNKRDYKLFAYEMNQTMKYNYLVHCVPISYSHYLSIKLLHHIVNNISLLWRNNVNNLGEFA